MDLQLKSYRIGVFPESEEFFKVFDSFGFIILYSSSAIIYSPAPGTYPARPGFLGSFH